VEVGKVSSDIYIFGTSDGPTLFLRRMTGFDTFVWEKSISKRASVDSFSIMDNEQFGFFMLAQDDLTIVQIDLNTGNLVSTHITIR
jgi:hypothetical protein